ncbi:MAG: HNH endonuclease signature motif containing protein [Planctomycetota bacterium]|nr:HNH endonuclease signature motif containing protein [Xanthomonadales bacterium]MDZ4821128.1 HNH endonuclease signature motif containing protein [Planctomycetota bacterium]
MIRLHKRDVPADIAQRIADRTARYRELQATGEEIPAALNVAYRDPQVKLLLRAETSDKCAYCESKIPHVDFGDVEHIISKAARPDLRYEYANLTYACGVCNTKKGNYHNDGTPLLNPYEDDPDEHLIAVGPMVMRDPRSDRGLLTQKRLELNRGSLIERRSERLEAIGTLMDQIARTTNPRIRDVLLEQVRLECESQKEYAFVVRGYVKSLEPMVDVAA